MEARLAGSWSFEAKAQHRFFASGRWDEGDYDADCPQIRQCLCSEGLGQAPVLTFPMLVTFCNNGGEGPPALWCAA